MIGTLRRPARDFNSISPSRSSQPRSSRITPFARSTSSGSRHAELRTALATGAYGLALGIAEELRHVSLSDAVRLTILAAKSDPERFDALAQRCIVCLIEERRLTLSDVLRAAQRFQDAREGGDGETGLIALLCQKQLRRQPAWLDERSSQRLRAV